MFNDPTANCLQKIFKILYLEGYSIPEIIQDDKAVALINEMSKVGKINEKQMEIIKKCLHNTTLERV